MKIVDLGEMRAPVLLFGGPYSNVHALRALLDAARRLAIPARRMICTGDIVAYCADGPACIKEIRAHEIASIAGNCEVQLARGAPDCGCGFAAGTACDLLSVSWYAFAANRVSEANRAFLDALPDRIVFSSGGRRFAVIHGGARDVAAFWWPDTPEVVLRAEIAVLEEQVGPVDGVIAGHCGIPFIRSIGARLWVNAGVIGLPPNDGRAATRFAVLDAGRATLHDLVYAADAARNAMVRAGLTQGYHDALVSGYWPSEDVLPSALRRHGEGA